MSKLANTLLKKPRNLVSIYFTAGYPHLESLPTILSTLKDQVDFVEVGIPYSDPLCDGPTIQVSGEVALQNGLTIDILFDQIESANSSLPLVMMGYFNSVLQYGVERFCSRCQSLGIAHVILPDLPYEIFTQNYAEVFSQFEINLIELITPDTSDERIREIDMRTDGFIYAVSTASTTGSNQSITAAKNYLERIMALNVKHPIMVGFNIATREDVEFVHQIANGAIIGSAFIRALQSNDLSTSINQYIQSINIKEL